MVSGKELLNQTRKLAQTQQQRSHHYRLSLAQQANQIQNLTQKLQ
jgi:hypothetical protein